MMFVFVLISNTDIEKVGLFTSRQSGNLPCAHLSIIKKMEVERKNEKNKKYTTPPRAHVLYYNRYYSNIHCTIQYNCINSNYNF